MKLSASVLAVQYLLSQETETFVDGIAMFDIVDRGSFSTTLSGFNGKVLVGVLTSTLNEAGVMDNATRIGVQIETPVRVLAGELKEVLGEALVEDKMGEIFTEPTGYDSIDILADWVDNRLGKPGDFKVDVHFMPCAQVVAEPVTTDKPGKAKGADKRQTGCGRDTIGNKITY